MREGLRSSVKSRTCKVAEEMNLVTGFELNNQKNEVLIVNELEAEGTMTDSENSGCGENGDIRRDRKGATEDGSVRAGPDGVDPKQLKGALCDDVVIEANDRSSEKIVVEAAAPNGKPVPSRKLLRRSTRLLRDDEKNHSSVEVKGNVGWSGSFVENSVCVMELDQDPSSSTTATLRKKGKIHCAGSIGSIGDTIKSGRMAVEAAVPNGEAVQCRRSLRRRTILLMDDEKRDGSIEVKDNVGWSGSPAEKSICEVELDQDPSSNTIATPRKRGNLGSAESNGPVKSKYEAETSQLKRRAGRPSKRQRETVLLNEDTSEHKSRGFTQKRKMYSNFDGNPRLCDNSFSEQRSTGEEMSVTKIGYSRKGESDGSETHGQEPSSRKRSKHAVLNETVGKFAEKQLIKERIIDLLLEYGWKIEKRPRRGKDYEDSVYVSPQGRGYWSATLAYSVLKSKMEDGEDNGSSTFTPIPEETINILTRITKKSKEKKNSLGKTDELNQDVVISKKLANKNCNKEILMCSTQVVNKSSHVVVAKKSSKGKLERGAPKSISKRSVQEPQSRKRCGLLVRNSKNGHDLEDGCAPYPWKRMVLTWMVDSGIVPLNGKVQYFNKRKTRVLLEGRITRDGIKCGCCEEVVSFAEFVSHSGSKLSQPLQNIFMENGTSLLQCQIDSWNKQEESERSDFHYVDVNEDDQNDDTCGTCGDGGDLICCDSCPSTFHQSCLEIQNFPPGDWNCIYCMCKSCGLSSCKSNISDDSHDISRSSVLTCHMCEERYHRSCIQIEDSGINNSGDSSFCGEKCKELSEKLQMLLGTQQELEEGFSWSLVKRSDIGTNVSLTLMPHKVISNSKLAVAFSIMDECFVPLSDYRTGVNLIRNVVYNSGSNFNRLNYSGFYTAILERGDEIISAASIRIHGCQLAEMPFIGTRHMYRRQGMCSRLLNAIERALGSLKIEKLVIPAIAELMQTWTSVFGFKPLEKSTRQEMKCMNMLAFPGVDMLQKPLLEKIYSENVKHTSDTKSESKKADDTKKSNERVATHANEISRGTYAPLDITINCPDSGADPNHPVHLDTNSHTPDTVKETRVNYEISGCSSHEANEQNSVVETCTGQNVASCSMDTTLDPGNTNCLEISACDSHERNEKNPIEDVSSDENVVCCSIVDTLDDRINRPRSEPNEDGNLLEIFACDSHERNERNSIEEIGTDQNVVSFSVVTTHGEMITRPHSEPNEDGDCLEISACDFHERNERHLLEEINTEENVVVCSTVTIVDEKIVGSHSEPNLDGNCLEISACDFHERNEESSLELIEEMSIDQNAVSCPIVTTLDEMITGHAKTNEDNNYVDDESTARQDAAMVDAKAVSFKVGKEVNPPENPFGDFQQLPINGYFIEDEGINHCITPSSHVDMNPATSTNREGPVHGTNGPCETFTYAVDCLRNIDSMFTEPDIETYIAFSLDDANLCNPPELTVDALEGSPAESPNGDCSFDVVTLPGNDLKTNLSLKKPDPESHSGITTASVHVPSNPFLGDILLANPDNFTICLKQPKSESLMDQTRMSLSNSVSPCNQASVSGVDSFFVSSGCNARGIPEVITASNKAN